MVYFFNLVQILIDLIFKFNGVDCKVGPFGGTSCAGSGVKERNSYVTSIIFLVAIFVQ